VIFAEKDGKTILIVPYMTDGGLSEEKARTIVKIARNKYIEALLKKKNSPDTTLLELLEAPLGMVPLYGRNIGNTITTIFTDKTGAEQSRVVESGILPIHDEKVNTYELVR
jgi:hypothetical protein